MLGRRRSGASVLWDIGAWFQNTDAPPKLLWSMACPIWLRSYSWSWLEFATIKLVLFNNCDRKEEGFTHRPSLRIKPIFSRNPGQHIWSASIPTAHSVLKIQPNCFILHKGRKLWKDSRGWDQQQYRVTFTSPMSLCFYLSSLSALQTSLTGIYTAEV